MEEFERPKRQEGLESDIKSVFEDWGRYKDDYALYVLNPFFLGFNELLKKEKNKKPGESASYSSLDLYKTLASINKNLLDDDYFKKAIEIVHNRTAAGVPVEGTAREILRPLRDEMKKISDELNANTKRSYSLKEAYDILLRVNNGFKKDKYLIDSMELIKKKYG